MEATLINAAFLGGKGFTTIRNWTLGTPFALPTWKTMKNGGVLQMFLTVCSLRCEITYLSYFPMLHF
jgi:hypothetical protein